MFGKSVRLTCLKEKINRSILWNIRFLKHQILLSILKIQYQVLTDTTYSAAIGGHSKSHLHCRKIHNEIRSHAFVSRSQKNLFQSAIAAESRWVPVRTEASPQSNTLTTTFHREDGVLWVVHLLLCSPNISSISLATEL